MSDDVKEDLLERSVIYHSSTLNDFQKKVNSAAADIALKEPRLVRKGNRGILLEKARQQVSTEGYAFRKAKSRSKVYGSSAEMSPTAKLSEEVRTQRIRELREDIEGLERHLAIKEKRLRQAESSQEYSLCDRFLEQIRELKSSRREKFRELAHLEAKEKRAKRYRESRSHTMSRAVTPSTDHPSSNTPSIPPTPSPQTASSPVCTSPVFVPNYTEQGCTSYSEPVSVSEPESSIMGSSTAQHF